jgi:hypothetical protein
MSVTKYSAMSLYLVLASRGETLSTATGFAVIHDGVPHLLTNRHNLSGRRTDTNQPMSPTGALPVDVAIVHVASTDPVNWDLRVEPLYDDEERPLWREHPSSRDIDIAALPLTNLSGVEVLPYSLEPGQHTPFVSVAAEVSVIGFPFATRASGFFGIWTRGTVASEMELDFEEKPCFLIDSRTRPGQSGSPVIHYSPGGPVLTTEGTILGLGEQATLMGIYSGRINNESDLGKVWKVSAIREVLENGRRPEHNDL